MDSDEPQGSNRGGLAYGLAPEISRLLYNNDPRADYQVAEITNSLSIARNLKEDLSLKVTQLRMELMRREREELHATRHIALCEFALAPVRRIPPELLSQIFLCYGDLLGEDYDCLDVKHGVWLLGHICSHWRTVARSTPELWNWCAFSCDSQKRNALALVETRLKLTGNRPLCIGFTCSHTKEDDQKKRGCRRIMDAFIAYAPRWSELVLEVPDTFYHYGSMDLQHKIPNLRKLRVVARHTVDTLINVVLITSFSVAPQLRDVSLRSFSNPNGLILLPHKQLTSYAGSATAIRNILQDAPQLVSCTLYRGHGAIPGGETRTLGLQASLTHQLQHLRLEPGSARPELLTLPALQSLHLSAADTGIVQSVALLLQRSMAAPTALRIDAFRPTPEVVALLAAAPSIAQLALGPPVPGESPLRMADADPFFAYLPLRIADTDPFFARFVEGGEDAPVPLLPALRTLSVEGLAFGEAFTRMVEARCLPAGETNSWTGARLESVTIADVGDTHISHLLRLKKLEGEAGLRVSAEAVSAVRVLR
ncbi:hypothetical protein C8R46DRAFT_672388 [Mycena filopes]|nr:hypothetical protein C8R46DRAFT_672388 [Mycena filopes]